MYQIEFDNEILRQKINSQCLTLDGYHLVKLYSILLVYHLMEILDLTV